MRILGAWFRANTIGWEMEHPAFAAEGNIRATGAPLKA
jgi:hypothetical protein